MKYPSYIKTESERELAGDFRKFLWYVWKKLRMPKPTRIQYDMAEYLQNGPRKRYISAFRGVGKSWITCAYVAWRLWRNPQLRIMIISANEGKALENAIFIKQLINTLDILKDLRGGERDSVLAFDVGPADPSPSPSVKAVGITGQITGSRADVILSDDVEIPKNSVTEVQREKLEEATKEYAAVMKPNSEIIYLGTPQTAQSIYSKLPGKGYEARIWPSRYPTKDKVAAYGDTLAPILRADIEANPELCEAKYGSPCGGAPTDPERFSNEDLLEREAEYGRSGFMLQFQLDTRLSDSEKYPLKTSDMIVLDLNREIAPTRVVWASSKELIRDDIPNIGFDGDRLFKPMFISQEWVPYQGAILVIDPSGRGADETSYCVLKMLHGILYVTEWGGLHDGYDEKTLKALANLAKTHQVNRVLYEANFGDGMFGSLFGPVLQKIYPCTLEEFKVSGQKEKRIIDTLEPVLNQHRLVFDTAVLKKDIEDTEQTKYSGVYQLTHLTAERGALVHDDRADVLAMAVNYWTKRLGMDPETAEERYREKHREKALKDFMGQVMGRPSRKRGMIPRR